MRKISTNARNLLNAIRENTHAIVEARSDDRRPYLKELIRSGYVYWQCDDREFNYGLTHRGKYLDL